jgi:phenylacetate-CoA ligase
MEDLKKIPSVTKDDIRNNTESICSIIGPKGYPVKTSGATGSPLKFYKDRVASAYSYATMYRGLQWHNVDVCDKEAYLWGIPIDRKERLLALLRDFILNRFREKKFNLTDEVFIEFFKKMQRCNPTLLSGYSSLLYEFALFLKKKNLPVESIKLKIIKYTAEMMYEFQWDCLKNVFDCPVIGEYGSAEIGVMAFQCVNKNYHVFNDCCVLEFEKSENDGLYEIVATNLNAKGFPFVRYRTGDLVDSPGFSRCQCGLPFPIMGKIIGRSADIVLTPEGKRIHCNIFSYIIKYLMKKGYHFDKILFVQENLSNLAVTINPLIVQNSKFQADLTSLINDKISPSMQIEIKPFLNEKNEQRGKLRYFISKLKEGDIPSRSK